MVCAGVCLFVCVSVCMLVVYYRDCGVGVRECYPVLQRGSGALNNC
jgi:hypothetical protein